MSGLTVPFIKASACGNDFLLIDFERIANTPAAADLAEFTRKICDRHDGIGADGVEWMHPHGKADVEIRLINADGSEAEISGNGTRCVAAYICEQRQKKEIAIQTGAGLKSCALIGRSGPEFEFEAGMGAAVVEAEMAVAGGARGIPVSMGNPHYVVFVREFAEHDHWQEQAANIQRGAEFKQHGVNVEMAVVDGRHDVRVRFYERGVGETRSSGTGSCAAAMAAIAVGQAESPVRVHAQGGTQTVRAEGNQVWLRGAARLIGRGEYFLD